ncbi:hypothetical protein B566_EDAN003030 [Ephemera danica]|nr:hypothetical protein B566_EDAN003030 [Ephemera danica]
MTLTFVCPQVRDLVERCTCPTQFPMIRVSEGKYRIGDTKVLIFVRILRKHVMVRVGGGWDTLSHYLDKHDPCRCRAGHRGLAGATRLITKSGNQVDLNTAQVHYDRNAPGSPPRTRRSSTSSVGSGGTPQVPASPARGARQRSRSPRPPAQQQRSRSPRPPVTVTAASDSGSEVSDEGYRSLGVNNKLLPPGIDEADTHERPESAMTNTSDCSSSTPDDTLPPPRRIPTSRRSASPCVRKDAPDARRATTPSRTTGPLPRSRSVSGEPGINTLSPTKSPLSRTAVGYRSVRTKSTTNPPEQQNTWNAPRSNKSRPTISQDTFQPFGPPSVRRSLPSRSHPSSTHSTPTRKPSRQQNKQSSTPTSPSKHVSPILQQILATSESTRNEDEFLQNLRQIINQYEHKIPPADAESLTREWVESEYGKPVVPTPRKSSHDDNDTRIPVPTFYKQTSKGALIDSAATSSTVTPSGLDTTCCL